MIDTESANLLLGRERTYRLLARVFRNAPDAALILGLANTISQESEGGDSSGYVRLRRWAEGISATTLPGIERELAMAYARLVLNTGSIPCYYPCESVYTSPECLMKQQAYVLVLALYQAEGLARVEHTGEPEDHISMEMEFMAHLCAAAGSALQEGQGVLYHAFLGKQREFLDQHLLRWVPKFIQNLKDAEPDEFYLAVAEITEEFLRDEPANLAELSDAGAGAVASHRGGSLN